jgi:predicted metal-dependent phosphoesterase TrpH
MIYDLHAHSVFSDGTLAPTDVVRRAHAHGVTTLALTDHDSTDGLHEAAAAAADVGLRLVNGCELSVTWNTQLVHILGLGVDPAHAALTRGLEQLRGIRTRRAQEMARQLEKHGVPDAMNGALRHAANGIVTRRHFAQYLVELGLATTVRTVFDKFLRSGKPGHVKTQWAPLADAVEWINAAGGVAVIAHPQRYGLTATKLRRLAREFIDCGGAGLEVISGAGGDDAVQSSAALAERFDLYASVGSDFHDPEQAWNDLGRLAPLPNNLKPVWTHPRLA